MVSFLKLTEGLSFRGGSIEIGDTVEWMTLAVVEADNGEKFVWGVLVWGRSKTGVEKL